MGWIPEGISWYGVRHWVDEQGHWENTTEQVWVPNVVTVTDTPATTKKVYDHTEYWFEYDGYTTTSRSDCYAHQKALLIAGHPSNFSTKDVYTTQTVPAVTYCESCGRTYPTVRCGRICPHCGSSETYLLTGNRCVIKEIEAESGPAEAVTPPADAPPAMQ